MQVSRTAMEVWSVGGMKSSSVTISVISCRLDLGWQLITWWIMRERGSRGTGMSVCCCLRGVATTEWEGMMQNLKELSEWMCEREFKTQIFTRSRKLSNLKALTEVWGNRPRLPEDNWYVLCDADI